MRVPFSYLDRQFANPEPVLDEIRELVKTGQFTLGPAVAEFEKRFAELCGAKHAIGVGSGTDALILPMKLSGIGPGDEVITAANTFIASVGAIAMTGATPVLVDNDEGYVLDPEKIESALTPRTKAILPVHYSGNVANMPAICKLAERHNLLVIEDACQAIGATWNGQQAGTFGLAGGFSLHPLKNLHVWGDAGVVITNSDEFAENLKLYRNHGLVNRDEVAFFGHNSRIDALQAVIGNQLIGETEQNNQKRIQIAEKYDNAFKLLQPQVKIPKREEPVRHVFHLYILRVERRNELLEYLIDKGVEAKIHYPIPIHLQEAAKPLGYQRGDFPVAEEDADLMITLPAHQYLTEEEVDYTIETLKQFYA